MSHSLVFCPKKLIYNFSKLYGRLPWKTQGLNRAKKAEGWKLWFNIKAYHLMLLYPGSGLKILVHVTPSII